jgi:hypothetical protein
MIYNDWDKEIVTLATDMDIKIKHYIPVLSNKGGMTIAYYRPKGYKVMELATAVCVPKDQYDKRVGRVMALRNFLESKTIQVNNNPKENSVN